jgi:hypothetical protein
MSKPPHTYDNSIKMFSARFGSSIGLNLDVTRPLSPSSEFARSHKSLQDRNDEKRDVCAQQKNILLPPDLWLCADLLRMVL